MCNKNWGRGVQVVWRQRRRSGEGKTYIKMLKARLAKMSEGLLKHSNFKHLIFTLQ